MTTEEHNMLLSILENTGELNLHDYYFKIIKRIEGIYELDMIQDGVKTRLALGSYKECINMADMCLNRLNI